MSEAVGVQGRAVQVGLFVHTVFMHENMHLIQWKDYMKAAKC